MLRSATGSPQTSLEKPDEFAAALRKAMSDAQDIELLFAIWEQNVETVRALNRACKDAPEPRRIAQNLVHISRPAQLASPRRGALLALQHPAD